MHNVVLTVYLTDRPDPQRNITWKPDDSKVVSTWIKSLTRCGLRGIIFHDNLSPEFTEDWASANVSFEQVHWHTPWTAAEERIRIYRDWLRDNQCEFALTTDLSDVEFYYDPFRIIRDQGTLYIGSESLLIGNTKIMCQWMERTYGKVTDEEKPILNPGIVGGQRDTMFSFLSRWLDEMGRAITPTPPPHDITAFNRLVYRENVHYVTGHPLHTVFRKNQNANSGAAIRHK